MISLAFHFIADAITLSLLIHASFARHEFTTFAVAPVNRSNELLPRKNLSTVGDILASDLHELKLRAARNAGSETEKSISMPQFQTAETNHLLVDAGRELRDGFISAIYTAYNKHLPLILSPDDLWLTVALRVADFLGNDPAMAEKYRKTFVDHDAKMQLLVTIVPAEAKLIEARKNKGYWLYFIDKVVELIASNTKTDISSLMTTPFSTSLAVEKTTMRITLMESMKNYFEYVMVMACGIPEITLEGRVEDYQSIVDRIDQLRKILPDLDAYLLRLRGHIEKIRDSRAGTVDTDWWRRMVRAEFEGSGGDKAIDGWIADFVRPSGGSGGKLLFQAFDKFAVTNTPAILDDQIYTQKRYNMTLSGGFLGVSQDTESKALRPAIGWVLFYDGDDKERPPTWGQ